MYLPTQPLLVAGGATSNILNPAEIIKVYHGFAYAPACAYFCGFVD